MSASAPAAAAIPSSGSTRLHDWLLAISLGNISFFEYWHKILYASDVIVPTWRWTDLLAMAGYVVIMTLVMRALIRLARVRWLSRFNLHRVLCAITPLIFLYVIWLKITPRLYRHVEPDLLQIYLWFAAVVVCYVIYGYRKHLLRFSELLTLWLVAFVPMTFGQSAWLIATRPPLPPLAPYFAEQKLANPIVVVLFDEMDWKIAFSHRDPSLKLPAFDRFYAESFSAERTYQIGSRTREVVPKIMTNDWQDIGGRVGRGLKIPEDDLRKNNVLKMLRAQGVNTAVAGWFIPYCRVFNEEVVRCTQEALPAKANPKLLFGTHMTWWTALFDLEDKRQQIARQDVLLRESRELLRDPQLGLVYLHFAMPHDPWIYDRHSGSYSYWVTDNINGYLGNLVLADQTFGELRKVMEHQGTWEKSTVIMLSDHFLRMPLAGYGGREGRVPFFIKLPGTQGPFRYEGMVLNKDLHDLLLELAAEKIKSNDDLRRFFEAHTPTEIPQIPRFDMDDLDQ